MFLPDAVLDHVSEASGEPDLSATKYRLLRTIGQGGMGVVWAAEDGELEREVAIKVSTAASSSSGQLDRLRLEARVIARLEHPGIVPVHDLGTLPDGRVYYVMKLVRGERLDAWAKGKERKAALRLFQRICEAVAFAHARGVIHRDLKPENIMVGALGEALVMDWGIARDLGAGAGDGCSGEALSGGAGTMADAFAVTVAVREGATVEGTVMGTPAYMPPEQARGEIASLDARADVYGLGAILYFLLAGRPPFSGAIEREDLDERSTIRPDRLRELDGTIAAPLESIVLRAMANERGDRYPSALELADDVGAFLDADPVRAHRETPIEIGLRFLSRHRVLVSLLATYLLIRLLLVALGR